MSRQQHRWLSRHPLWRWPPGAVVLGYTASGKPIYIPAEMRALGVHILGLPGQGKSRGAEALLRQDFLQLDGEPRGGVLLDPHGTLFTGFLGWYVTHNLHRIRTIRVLDPSDARHVFHLNPLRRRPGVDPAVIAAAVTNAVLQVWGGDATATPQLRTTLKHTFYTLSELNLPLIRAADLLDLTDSSGLRAYAAEHVRNPVVRQFWRELSALRLADREARVGSAMRRLTEFLLPARVRAIFSEPERALDWREVMDSGQLVIVNLAFDSGKLSEDEAQVIGVMMLAEIFLAAQGRPTGAVPFYLYLDECHRFLTPDIAKIITEGRKFGVHAGALIHQTLGQLREAGDFVESAIKACRTKIVYALQREDAEEMAPSIFIGQFDLQRDKARYRKPVVVGQELNWLLSESESVGSAVAHGTNWSAGGSQAQQHSRTVSLGRTNSVADTTSRGRTKSRSTTDTASAAQSSSRTLTETAGTSTSAMRSWTSGQSAGFTQDWVNPDHDRKYRLRYPEPGTTINDTDNSSEGGGSTEGQSWSSGTADTSGETITSSAAESRGTADTTGHAQSVSNATTETFGETFGTTDTESWSYGGSTTETANQQETHGRSQGLRSVFQVLPGQSYTLQELIHLASVTIAHLRQGECLVKIGRRPSARIKTLRVEDGWARPEHINRVTAKLAAATPYVTALAPVVDDRNRPPIRLVSVGDSSPSAPIGPKGVDDDWG